jgi:predicted PurR-regulated permease PerM
MIKSSLLLWKPLRNLIKRVPMPEAEVALMIWALISVVMLVAAVLVVVTILATLVEAEVEQHPKRQPNRQPSPQETKEKLHYWPNHRLNETMMRDHEDHII